MRMRSRTCEQVLGWYCTGNSCKKCAALVWKFNNESEDDVINLSKVDGEDLHQIFNSIFPGASPEMKDFLSIQHNILSSKSIKCLKWDKSVIKTCLSMWSRSVSCYEELRDSHIFVLPSGRHLRRFKNSSPQTAGINEEIFRWMLNSAKQVNLPVSGYYGGILHVHVEAKIQEDLVIKVKGGTNELIGWVDTGDEGDNLRILKEQNVTKKLATDVLQITFLGYTGFRFPVAHYPTDGVKASELYIILWEVISKLQSWGFIVDYIMQDGGQQNRECTKLHFREDPRQDGFMSDSLVHPNRKVFHCQDISHNIKKLRNAVLSSGVNTYNTKLLTKGSKAIVWEQWLNAAKWDEQTNSRKINYKLSSSHLHPDSSEKMRNHLAEQVLDDNMLNLMKQYQLSLINNEVLNGAIEFLENTSKLINIFRDPRPVVEVNDMRLKILQEVLNWFTGWRTEIASVKAKPKQKEKMLPSLECLDDIESTIVVFLKLCEIHMSEFKENGIYPSRFNSDLAENIFCQQRGLYNGNATNPNYETYCNTMNSVILGQTSKCRARKSNAGIPTADPCSFHVNIPLIKKKKTLRI